MGSLAKVTWERRFCWPEEMGQGAKERWGNKPFPLPCSWRTMCSHHLSSFTVDCLCIFTPTLTRVPGEHYWTLFILISPDPGESLAPLGHHPSLRDPTDEWWGWSCAVQESLPSRCSVKEGKGWSCFYQPASRSSWAHLTSPSCEFSGHLSSSPQPHHILITVLHTRLTFIPRAIYAHGGFSS